MICQKCGTLVPDGRSSCLNCGAPIEKSSSFDDLEKESGGDAYTSSSGRTTRVVGRKGIMSDKLMSRWLILGLGFGGMIVGIILSVVLFLTFPYLVILWAAAIGICVLMPLFGGILQAIGFNKVGGVFMIIGGIPMVPIGLISIMGGIKALKAGSYADEMREKHPEASVHGDVRIRTGTPAKVVLIVLIVMLIVIPTFATIVGYNRPLLTISNVDMPSSFKGDLPISMNVKNVGMQDAEKSKIRIEVTIDGDTRSYKWSGSDIASGEEVYYSFKADTTGNYFIMSVKIAILYDGMTTDSYSTGI